MKLVEFNTIKKYVFGSLLASLLFVSCTEENVIELEPYKPDQ